MALRSKTVSNLLKASRRTLCSKGFYFIREWQAIRQKIESELNGSNFYTSEHNLNESLSPIYTFIIDSEAFRQT